MKELKYIIVVAILLLTGCTEKPHQAIVEEYNTQITIIPFETQRELPPDVEVGAVKAYKGKDKIEQNMLSQYSTYVSALFQGDIDNALHYMYKDATKYFRKYYIGKSDEEIEREFYKGMSDEMLNILRKFRERGLELTPVVSRILRKVTIGQEIVLVFETYSNFGNENLQIHMAPEQDVAVSFNEGKNWTFNVINEDTPSILRIHFSDDTVDKIMGY